MKEFYMVRYNIYRNGKYIGHESYVRLLDEEKAVDCTVPITWDNLQEIWEEYGKNGHLPFTIWNFKRGRKIAYFANMPFEFKFFSEPREWFKRDKNLNMELKITYKKCSMSLNEILNYHDAEASAQYLAEHFPFLAINRIQNLQKAIEKI